MNMTLFGNRVFTDVIKLSCIMVSLNPIMAVATNGKKIQNERGDTQKRRTSSEDEERDPSGGLISQGTPRIASNHQKLRSRDHLKCIYLFVYFSFL
jgi:hypothetical protein